MRQSVAWVLGTLIALGSLVGTWWPYRKDLKEIGHRIAGGLPVTFWWPATLTVVFFVAIGWVVRRVLRYHHDEKSRADAAAVRSAYKTAESTLKEILHPQNTLPLEWSRLWSEFMALRIALGIEADWQKDIDSALGKDTDATP